MLKANNKLGNMTDGCRRDANGPTDGVIIRSPPLIDRYDCQSHVNGTIAFGSICGQSEFDDDSDLRWAVEPCFPSYRAIQCRAVF